MGKTILNMTMSLDGFIAGPEISKQVPMGIDGELLHKWLFDEKTETDTKILQDFLPTVGAVIIGGNTYNLAIEDAWNKRSPFDAPSFVVCHHEPKFLAAGFTFVYDGIHSAYEKAKKTAGDKNIWLMGGANICQQFLGAGLVDQLQIPIAPLILGKGKRLFAGEGEKIQLVKTNVIDTKGVTHLFYDVAR